MTPPTPPSPDNSLPPRHRPALGNLAKDTTEGDLWDFDLDDDESPPRKAPEHFKPQPIPRQRPSGTTMPTRDGMPDLSEKISPLPSRPAEGLDSVQVNVSKPKPRMQSGSIAGQSAPGKDFDDLQEWEDAPSSAEPEELPAIPATAVESELTPEPELPVDQMAAEEPTPPPTAAAPIPRLNLTGLERLGLIALAAVLAIGGGLAFYHTIYRLPAQVSGAVASDFPIEGKNVTIQTADSYWRTPVTSGDEADTFQRGTLLLPELTLSTRGGPAALRVFFRNEDGQLVGDAVTRSVNGEGQLKMAATGGFDDIGMHAAYRAGRTKAWKIEVYEAPSANSPPDTFKKLFDMDVSTVRR